jgi:hypothetical protein
MNPLIGIGNCVFGFQMSANTSELIAQVLMGSWGVRGGRTNSTSRLDES